MYCPHCGEPIPDDSLFCQKCGNKIEPMPDETSAEVTQAKPSALSETPAAKTAVTPPAEIIISGIDELISTGYKVKIGDYISRGWEIFTGYMGGFVGYYVIVTLITFFLALIPYFGALISAVIGAPLRAGFFIVAFRKMKNQEVEFSDFFGGFNYFLPLFLLTLISGIFIVLGLALLIIPGLYLAIAYAFALPLIIDRDRKLDFWDAMEASRKVVTKKWFSIFGFVLLLGLINIAGFIALLIGLLFTGPLIECSLAAAYEDIFGIKSAEL